MYSDLILKKSIEKYRKILENQPNIDFGFIFINFYQFTK